MRTVSSLEARKLAVKGENLDYKTNMTTPAQSMTIREIMTRFALSGNIDAEYHGVHYDGVDGEVDESHVDETLDPSFDLSDATRIKEELEENERVRLEKRKQKIAEKQLKDKELEKEALKKELLDEIGASKASNKASEDLKEQ